MCYAYMHGVRSFIFQADIDRILRFVEHRKSLCYVGPYRLLFMLFSAAFGALLGN